MSEDRQDKLITCISCRMPFPFTEGEQDYFAIRGLQEPRRCKGCREARRRERDASERPYDVAS
jgi:hypothetical protein